ncbi:MAG: hypothetical protein ACO1N6_04295 [Microcella sp.]
MPTRDTHGRSIDDADELAFTLPDGTSIGKRGDRIEASLTYTRSWRIIDGRWQVVSGAAAAS